MFNFIGIDPGTNYCGVAIFNINDDMTINNLNTILIDLTEPRYSIIENNLNYRLERLYEITSEIFQDTLPVWLAIEAGFINRFRPAAYGPIAKSIFAIEKAFMDNTGLRNITEYPPSIVKQVVSKHGLANKNDMFLAVSNIEELSKFLIGNESEHEIDAISIGYTQLINFRKYPELLIL